MRNSWRINFVFLFFLSFAGLMVWRLVQLQIIRGDYYRALAEGFHESSGDALPERGEFFLKNGEALAVNKNFPLVFASPVKVENPQEAAPELARILQLPEDQVAKKLQKDALYSLLKKKLTPEEVESLKKINLEGIYLRQERNRYYPQESLLSQALGFVDANFEGKYGLEEYYNEELLEEKDITLTIDYNIQFQAEKALKGAGENLKIEAGEILVADPQSGAILAMANFPGFNPNIYGEYAENGNLGIFQNGSTQKIFEPGSVFKAITMAAGLEEEKVNPQSKYVDEGFVLVSGRTISNYNNRIYGEQTMTNVLEKSINTGAIFVERQLGNNLFLKYIEKFGFFEKTGIDVPETYSENKEFKKGYDVNFATASFGQGVGITSVQLVRAYSAIANGGNLIALHLSSEKEPEIGNQAISQKTASQLTAMLVSVIENGFNKAARIPGYYIAGNPGPAQVAWSSLGIDKSGYSDKTIQTFIGFFPAFNPKFLIMVKLNNPQTRTSEYSATPIFKELAKYIIDYTQLPPDYER